MHPDSVLREAVRLVRAHAVAWFAAAGLFLVPLAFVGPLSDAMVAPFWRPWGGRGGEYVLRAIEVFAHVVTKGVLVVFVLRSVAGGNKRWQATWGTTWNLALGRIRPGITASLAALLPLTGYMLLLFFAPLALARALHLDERLGTWYRMGGAVYLGGVVAFFSILLVYVMPVAMIEGLGGFAGYRRSRALLAASWRPTLAAMLPIVLLTEVLAGLANRIPAPGAAEVVRHLIEVAALPLEAATSVLLYLRLRSADQVLGDSVYSASMTSSLPPPPAPSGPPAPPSPPAPGPA